MLKGVLQERNEAAEQTITVSDQHGVRMRDCKGVRVLAHFQEDEVEVDDKNRKAH